MLETPRGHTYTITPQENEMRLDRWFKHHYPAIPYSFIAKLLRKGQIRINGKRCEGGNRIYIGDILKLPSPKLLNSFVEDSKEGTISLSPMAQQDLKSWVIFENEDVIILNKPQGLAVQGGSNTNRHVDGISAFLVPSDAPKPKLVHRLDKDTSGILVLAKTNFMSQYLTKKFRDHAIKKLYLAITLGNWREQGEIKASLQKERTSSGEKMVVSPEGDTAVTFYRKLDSVGKNVATLVAFRPLSGRTHQLRVHATFEAGPILGDGKYGGKESRIKGLETATKMHLHARRIILPMPHGRILDIVAPLPEHFLKTANALGLTLEGHKRLEEEVLGW